MSLAQALRAASPRLSPPPTPWISLLIHGAVLALWLLLLARALMLDGVFAWSIGLVYVGYDTALLVFTAWETRHLLRPRPPAPGPRATIGVLVAAHNEAGALPVTLAALFAQTDAPEQILVADDGSTDLTPTVLAGYGLARPAFGGIAASTRHPTLSWLRVPHGGKAVALNQAMTCLETEIVLTVDADTLLDPGAIAAMRAAFSAEPELVAATGVIAPVCGPSLGGRILQWFQTYEYIRNFLSRYAWMRLDSLLLISGAFAGFRREAVLEVGGFDPDCLVEDYELIHRLRRHAARHGKIWRSRVLGAALARTDAPATIPAFLRQRRRWFGGFLQTQYWYRDMVGDPRYGWLGTLMLPVKAIDTLQPVYGLTAFCLLLGFAATGRARLIGPVALVIGAKIAVDLAFHLWSVHLYRRWVGGGARAGLLPALLAAIAEPFTFQLLRHVGAIWGWAYFLAGKRSWGAQRRLGVVS